ncbi:PiggyBac transposable element-derived protein 4 [Cucumispora dikerogammari]|nr:PiggyBac transposable element-derived protein 4 [Cucumispora dikerogammari]
MTKALISSEIYVFGTLRNKRRSPDKLTTLNKAPEKGTQIVFFKSEVEVLILNDKKLVAMITNCHDTRRVISNKRKTILSCIKEYNKYMRGVDKFDQIIKYYPIKRKTNR